MLAIQPTENFTGVKISGDYWDLDAVSGAISALIGEKGKYYDYQGAHGRLLNVYHLFRRAMKGDKYIELVSNGANKQIFKEHNIIATEKNVYFSFNIFLPELLFTTFALNDFIRLHMTEVDGLPWNMHVTTARQFQAIVLEFLQEYVSEEFYLQFLQILATKNPLYYRYASQYVDVLNIEFLNLSAEERENSIALMAARLVEEDEGYETLKEQLLSISSTSKTNLHELPLNIDYPKDIEW